MLSSQQSEKNEPQSTVLQPSTDLTSPHDLARARRKANWHRARALKMGRTEHFTALEWLNLCRACQGKCAYCSQLAPLEPHHVCELHRGGGNSIENIEAICHACHSHIHEWPDDVSSAWMEFQWQLLAQFRELSLRGESVRLSSGTREQNETRRRGVLMEFIAPERGAVPLRGILPRGDWKKSEPFVSVHPLSADWWERRARAQVQWHAGGMWEEIVPLAHLARRERDTCAMISMKMKQTSVASNQKHQVESQLVLGF